MSAERHNGVTDAPRVALITEGSYPFTYGGVSTWCDQIVRGLPAYDFELITVTGRRGNTVCWDLPDNVVGVHELGFWEPRAPGEAARYVRAMGWARPDPATIELVDCLLHVLATNEPGASPMSLDELFDELIEASKRHRLAPAIRSRRAIELLSGLWHDHGEVGSLSDVVTALDILEHLLRVTSFELPDVDMYHPVSNGLAGLAAVAAAGHSDRPILLSEHGVYLRERYLEYLGQDLGPAIRSFLLRFQWILSIAVYRRAQLVIPVSRYNRRWERHNGVPERRIRVVHNGVDPERFLVDEDPVAPQRPTVGFVARIDRIKDPLTLVRAAADIRDFVPDVHVRMWGETAHGQDDYEAEVLAEIDRLQLHDVVSLEGRTNDVTGAFRSCDVVVMCSISEGLPYSVLEAMMTGAALVATDVGGIAEALDGVGVLVPPRDPAALAHAAIELLRSPELRHDLGRRARDRACSEFTLERMVRDYAAAYGELVPVIDLRHEPVELKQMPLSTSDDSLSEAAVP